jgi:Toprim domain
VNFALSFDTLEGLTRGSVTDVACPLCGPLRTARANRVRRVLRLYRDELNFIRFYCARCGEHGWQSRAGRRCLPQDRARIERLKADAVARDAQRKRERAALALRLWQQAQSADFTPADVYLRSRGISCLIPATIRFLPARDDYPPAMITAFGFADEPEPGVLAIEDSAVRAVHLTKLKPDGRGKADVPSPKIMIGSAPGVPLMLASCNDLQGLAITEGIEDALSMHCATGLGAWAAGAAGRLPELADAVPDYVECVSLQPDGDAVGQRYSKQLARGLDARGIEVHWL